MLWIVTFLSYVWDTIHEWELISVVKYSDHLHFPHSLTTMTTMTHNGLLHVSLENDFPMGITSHCFLWFLKNTLR